MVKPVRCCCCYCQAKRVLGEAGFRLEAYDPQALQLAETAEANPGVCGGGGVGGGHVQCRGCESLWLLQQLIRPARSIKLMLADGLQTLPTLRPCPGHSSWCPWCQSRRCSR